MYKHNDEQTLIHTKITLGEQETKSLYNLFMQNKQFRLGQAHGWMSSHGAMFSRNPSGR